MPMLEGAVDGVIGVDPHKHTLTAAAVDPVGAVLDQRTDRAEPAGYRRLLTFGRTRVPGRRVWALEGTGSYGAGLAGFLADHGEQVVEIDRPARPARRSGAKSDPLDAARAAREALAREHLASPRARGTREALRVLLTCRHGAVTARTATINQLKALVVSAPAQLRGQLAGVDGEELVWVCARLRGHPTRPIEHTATVRALRSTARRILALQTEVDEVGGQLERLVAATVPALLEVVGIGPVVAAQLLVSWSHPGRCAQRPRSRLWPAPRRSPPPRARRSATASTGPGTGSATGHCTPSCSPAAPIIRDPGLRRPSHRPGQDQQGDQPVPEAGACPSALQAPRSDHPGRPNQAARNHLTAIEASLPRACASRSVA
jgi:transposase